MNTHIVLSNIAHPSHDGESQFFYFILVSDDSNLVFYEVRHLIIQNNL